jgi:hypothetical protein
MGKRHWTTPDLAARMGGDQVLNRALLAVYFRNRTGLISLGDKMCEKIEAAFCLKNGTVREIEREWLNEARPFLRAAKGYRRVYA